MKATQIGLKALAFSILMTCVGDAPALDGPIGGPSIPRTSFPGVSGAIGGNQSSPSPRPLHATGDIGGNQSRPKDQHPATISFKPAKS